MKLYHYTSTLHLPFIQEDGFIKTVESNLSMTEANLGPDVVWLTTRYSRRYQRWAALSAVDKTQVRITVNVEDAQWWPKWARRQGITKTWYDALDAAGGYTAEEWYVVPRPIPQSEWLEIEVFE